MKLVTYRALGDERYGALVEGVVPTVLDFATALAWHEADELRTSDAAVISAMFGGDMLGFIRAQARSLPVARALVERAKKGALPASFGGRPLSHKLGGVQLLAPLPRPPSLRDGYAFRQHVAAARKNRGLDMISEYDEFPVFYFTNHQSIVGPGEVEVQRLHLDQLDFELEAAMVIGTGGKNLRAEHADAHVFGLTIMNDWSARRMQMKEMKLNLGPAKGKDFATSLGPYLVTTDELEPAASAGPRGARFDLAMTAEVNGVRVSSANLKDLSWTFAEMLERISYGATLFPGDVIGSGCAPTGCFLELNGSGTMKKQWLAPGDTVTLEIDRLGRLENRVVLVDS
jgi:fumarylacetoacetate (FAA) hydrolase